MRGVDRLLGLIVAAVTAGYFVTFRLGEERPAPMLAHDIYAEYYPNMLYALRSLREGMGLLWNPFQNCGQPFFGMSDTGLLYPANALFLLLEPGNALRGILFFNLVVAGAFTYWLCRELGTGRLAALGGAVAFELGTACIGLTTWTPMAAGPFVWCPAALLCCERLLRAPALSWAVGLAVVLGLALLPGYPQPVVFIYQLLALRVLWELVTRRLARPGRVLALLGLGLVLPPLLVAVQLLPGLEVARESVRNAPLSMTEMSPQGYLNLERMRTLATWRSSTQALVLVPCLLASMAVWRAATRRVALFYLVAGAIFYLLAFGPNTPLFAVYRSLPLGEMFHDPERLMWITSFCLAVLTALGIETLAASGASVRWRALAALAAMLVVAWTFDWYVHGLRPPEWTLVGLVAAACLTVMLVPGLRNPAAALGIASLVLNLVTIPPITWTSLMASDASLFAHAPLLERLQARMTPQDRVYIGHESERGSGAPPFGLIQKTASLFRLRSIFDYQPEIARRYAEYFVRLRRGTKMTRLNDVLFMLGGWFPSGFNRRLFDLTGSRYIVVSATVATLLERVTLLDQDAYVRVYQNPQALPRAFWVPRVEVVADGETLLERLASGPDDPRQVALIEAPPSSGFTGAPGGEDRGSVDFVRDDPEHVTLRVRAPGRGFLFLADEHFPGWRAAVEGEPRPILRANYAFRLVEVPAGESTVEFRYAPKAPWIGAGISALTIASLGVVLFRARRRRGNAASAATSPARG